ncbi:MAG: HNH endonuclease [Paludibacteraceae bacterium]|nr:HNH endonuclease [Paludibacteraceae bacterium]
MRKTTINLYGIRPKYQWEFVYDEKQRNAVMDTVWQNFPLNVMYWVKTEASTDLSDLTEQKSGSSVQSVDNIQYELLDGQQRTISICSFIAGEYMMNFDGNLLGFNNMTIEQQNRILDYKLQVYICEGTDEEKLRWFQRINIAGEKLKEQEIRNAIYSGSWVTQAKRRFSKTGCVAYKIGSDFMAGSPIRQDYFETALRWIADYYGTRSSSPASEDNMRTGTSALPVTIEQYMAQQQHDTDADELWQYYQDVIHWIEKLFGHKYKKEMKGVQWGLLYNKHKETPLTATAIGEQMAKLMADSDLQKKSGIFTYILDGDIHHLGIRAFDANTRREVYERQGDKCAICDKHFEIEVMEADHITPWVEGGRTIASNCQMLCRACNRRKSSK